MRTDRTPAPELGAEIIRERVQRIWHARVTSFRFVHAWVECLDSPVHDLGKAGQVAHRMGVDCGILDRLERAAGGEKLVTKSRKPAGEGRQASLVANRQ